MSAPQILARAVNIKKTLGLRRAAKYCANQGVPIQLAVSILARRGV